MKKLLLAIFVTSSVIHLPSSIRAAEHRAPINPPRSVFTDPVQFDEPRMVAPYVSVRVGGSSLRIDGESHFGGAYAAAVGARIIAAEDLAIRIEGEFAINSFSDPVQPGGGESTPMTFMANAYLDFMTDHIIQPYLGVGIGFTNHNNRLRGGGFQMLTAFESELVFGLYGGVGFRLTRDGALMGDVGVRYTHASMWGYSVQNMTYNAGLRFTF